MEELTQSPEDVIKNIYKSTLIKGDTAIDVGAHFGTHTIPMGELVFPKEKIFAIEPLQMYQRILGEFFKRFKKIQDSYSRFLFALHS